MTQDDISQIKEALAKASPAPWAFDGREIVRYAESPPSQDRIAITCHYNDNEAIPLLRNHANELIALAESAEKWRDVATAQHESLQNIAEYWNGGNESAVNAAEHNAETAHLALAAYNKLKEEQS